MTNMEITIKHKWIHKKKKKKKRHNTWNITLSVCKQNTAMVPDYIVKEDLWDNKASTAWIRSLKKAQAWSVGLFSDAS